MTNRHSINMPDIGEGVVEGEVVEWLKEVGDEVLQDEAIVVVMTDKATVELPTPYPGILAKKYYDVGQIAIKGKPLYDIETEIELSEKKEKISESIEKPIQSAEKFIRKEKREVPKTSSNKVLATPPIRKIAKELNIDINEIIGTGQGSRVTNKDLKDYLSKKQIISTLPTLPNDQIEKLAGIPKLMAEKMALSTREAAHFSYFEAVDATRLIQMKKKFTEMGKAENLHVTFVPFIAKALSLALLQFPKVNSSLDSMNNELIIHHEHHIGIAMTTELGLIVPVLRHVEKMSLEEVIRCYINLRSNALEKKLTPEEMKNSTITISNFGVLGGGKWATPIINYPEVAILALSKIEKQPIVKQDELVIKEMLNLSWSFDHRVIDGDTAASFSHYFLEILENPIKLL